MKVIIPILPFLLPNYCSRYLRIRTCHNLGHDYVIISGSVCICEYATTHLCWKNCVCTNLSECVCRISYQWLFLIVTVGGVDLRAWVLIYEWNMITYICIYISKIHLTYNSSCSPMSILVISYCWQFFNKPVPMHIIISRLSKGIVTKPYLKLLLRWFTKSILNH